MLFVLLANDGVGLVKSVKKRFKLSLTAVEQSAARLGLLSEQLGLLDDAEQLARKVLNICVILRARASELHKIDFAERMRQEVAIAELDELADGDLIGVLEKRFSEVCPEEVALQKFMGQLLDKLEACYAAMIENIQRLLAVLAQAD